MLLPQQLLMAPTPAPAPHYFVILVRLVSRFAAYHLEP